MVSGSRGGLDLCEDLDHLLQFCDEGGELVIVRIGFEGSFDGFELEIGKVSDMGTLGPSEEREPTWSLYSLSSASDMIRGVRELEPVPGTGKVSFQDERGGLAADEVICGGGIGGGGNGMMQACW